MGLFDWLFGKKKVQEQPKQEARQPERHSPPLGSSGVSTIVEFCSRNDLLSDSLLKKGIEELKQEGTDGSYALAGLIREMLSCRSPKIGSALWAAAQLKGTPELVSAVQEIMTADATAPQPGSSRFTPDIVGGGRVGWTDGTARNIRDQAKETLKALGVSVPDTPQKQASQSDVEKNWSDSQRELSNIIQKFAARDAHGIDVERQITQMKPEDTIPVLHRLLESDLNGDLGVAVVQSIVQFGKLEPELGMPLIGLAINSTHGSVRNVSISYLQRHRNAESKAIAAKRIQLEQRDDFRVKLQGVVDSQSQGESTSG